MDGYKAFTARMARRSRKKKARKNDCAIFTCYLMKRVVLNQDFSAKVDSDVMNRFKAELIEALVTPTLS
ncbi:hypothetical protein PHJA_002083000 [Phtheirospermum japonicum]|uniref:Uncharacterized protein n=1 Tax=Phtheirospermum japonicum TaxID=374723 RepID=A0A830CK74_9LAMI|nr:hypothetical protein PHJA_002083000 [Phtheirospermum japonicum]